MVESVSEHPDYQEDFVVSDAWRQEIQKRCQEIDADPSLLLDGPQVMDELKQRYL
ncbi:addiction module protein [Methylovulum psychrotolerans]|uniref:addiction module protein n=1 Tax=Methylovulum psychrotolerans TaxID=1704499 RepID=UPI001BFF3385|nr:addiction module protein [Methylovulum psychrotolerans]MBT9099065.1 addiction module protein [Methylovulum psychrotolerans]